MGPFCSGCGERRVAPETPPLRRLVRDGLRDALSLDAKLWTSFRLLFTRPGKLTAAFMEGRRSPYVRPVQLFLMANLVYFVVQPYTGFSGYNTTLQSHVSRQAYSEAFGIRERVLGQISERSEVALAGEFLANPLAERTLGILMEQGSVLIIAPCYFLGLRRTYGDTRGVALVRTVLLLGATIVSMLAYRLALFWTTYLTM